MDYKENTFGWLIENQMVLFALFSMWIVDMLIGTAAEPCLYSMNSVNMREGYREPLVTASLWAITRPKDLSLFVNP
jgi:hypothetical protein